MTADRAQGADEKATNGLMGLQEKKTIERRTLSAGQQMLVAKKCLAPGADRGKVKKSSFRGKVSRSL